MDMGSAKHGIISNKDETLKLFSNPLLERMTHINPITLLFIYVPAIIYFSYLSLMQHKSSVFMGEFILGVFLWTLIEYGMHRFIFHFHAKSKLGKRFFFLIHGIHHAYPRDRTRLVTPPIITVPVSALICIAYSFIFNSHYAAIFAGTIFGYLIFDLLHYTVHRFNVQGPIIKFIRIYHMRHHYMQDGKSYGVTSPFWDHVFGTEPSE